MGFSKKIVDNVYGRITFVSVCQTKEQLCNDFEEEFGHPLKKEYYEDFYDGDATSNGRTIKDYNICIILLKDDNMLNSMGTIAHECFHAVEFHFEYIGLKHNTEAGEAYAYYLQFLVKSIVEEMLKGK